MLHNQDRLTHSDCLARVALLRHSYRQVRAALPWLDATVWPEESPAFPEHAASIRTEYARAAPADPALTDALPQLQAEAGIRLLRLAPRQHPPADCGRLFDRMAQAGMPLAILHTDMDFAGIRALAAARPALNIIIESGPRKLIYHYTDLRDILRECPNVHCSTYNFCNWRGHEELLAGGLGHKLLYGSHMPLFAADAAMAPIIMGDFDWASKCAIAGNNLRRLLGLPALHPAPVEFAAPPPFIIDAHAHNLQPGARNVYAMPTPDVAFTTAEWIKHLDAVSTEQIFLVPGEVLFGPHLSSRDYTAGLRAAAPTRFFYMEMFHPAGDAAHVARVRAALDDPACVGIKIHPVTHKTPADADAYAPVYRLAASADMPIMTHSWEVSDYNPEQWKGHPDRFRRFLPELQGAPFVLGHAGGRPSAFDATVRVCRDFPNVHVDLAGDYFHNGMVDAFADAIGAEKIIFGTDVDWFDPRCELGVVLGSRQPDANLLKILRDNAMRVYRARRKTGIPA